MSMKLIIFHKNYLLIIDKVESVIGHFSFWVKEFGPIPIGSKSSVLEPGVRVINPKTTKTNPTILTY